MNGKSAVIEHYLSLRYPITLRQLSPGEGGGYAATIPQLGSGAFAAVGETESEALAGLEELRRELIPHLIEKGVELPEPEEEEALLDQYSGHLGLRIPRSLHARLAVEAKRNGCSINKLATDLLSRNLELASLLRELRGLLEQARQPISSRQQRHWLRPEFSTEEAADPAWTGEPYERAA